MGFGIWFLLSQVYLSAAPQAPLDAAMDSRGPYVILVSEKASDRFADAVAQARFLHPEATEHIFQPEDLSPVAELLAETSPRYALVFLLPDELDVNFAWQWLGVVTAVDHDPFVDVRTGFVTGASRSEAAQFMQRIASVASGRAHLPGGVVDNLGPNAMIAESAFQSARSTFFLPAFQDRFTVRSISHGRSGFPAGRLKSMAQSGIVHFGGHGYPNRIVDGLTASQMRDLQLSACVLFNGACYTGVTGRWFNVVRGAVQEEWVDPSDSFCLSALANRTVGYLAALHADHGIPVYQAMEFYAYTGASLGDIIKHTHDGVILASGGRLPELTPFVDQSPAPQWTPTDFMLNGTASRVLFGDPALRIGSACTDPPFDIRIVAEEPSSMQVEATLANASLRATYTDTYFSDLATNTNLFNDCCRLAIPMPPEWDTVSRVAVKSVTAGKSSIAHRLAGYGLEWDHGERILHVQVDVRSLGYMQSAFRQPGSRVVLELER